MKIRFENAGRPRGGEEAGRAGLAQGRQRQRGQGRRSRLVLEPLESRCLLSTITEYQVPNINGVSASPQAITMAGGKIWFSEQAGGIGEINPANPSSVTSYSNGLPTGAHPNAITAGPDGNIWFAETPHQIGILNVSKPSSSIVNLGSAQGLPANLL